MSDVSQLFATASEASGQGGRTSIPGEEKVFGTRYNGRYHMPTLPDELGTKSCPPDARPWVPRGIMSVTTMMDGFEESRGLSIWEQEQFAFGLVRLPSLYEELCIAVHQWTTEGVDFRNISEYPHVRKAITGGNDKVAAEISIVGRAKQAAGANEYRQAGTNRHAAWEHRAKTGELIGTKEIQAQTLSVEALLAANNLRRVPGLSERVVRNVAVRAAGRFDDILEEFDPVTGRRLRLLIADLKTKRKAFRSWMAVDGQLATYARSEWMLDTHPAMSGVGGQPLDVKYVPGPVHHVDLTEGVVLQMPSDGAPPYLRRADLARGWEVAQLARRVHDERSYGKSAERHALAEWVPLARRITGSNLSQGGADRG